jgi:hypothetical protein
MELSPSLFQQADPNFAIFSGASKCRVVLVARITGEVVINHHLLLFTVHVEIECIDSNFIDGSFNEKFS